MVQSSYSKYCRPVGTRGKLPIAEVLNATHSKQAAAGNRLHGVQGSSNAQATQTSRPQGHNANVYTALEDVVDEQIVLRNVETQGRDAHVENAHRLRAETHELQEEWIQAEFERRLHRQSHFGRPTRFWLHMLTAIQIFAVTGVAVLLMRLVILWVDYAVNGDVHNTTTTHMATDVVPSQYVQESRGISLRGIALPDVQGEQG